MRLIEAEPRDNLRLYAGILLLFTLSFYAFLIQPVARRLEANRTEYLRLRGEIQGGRVKARELLGYARRVNSLKGEVSLLEQQLRGGNQVLLFFKDAEQAALHAGVQLEGIIPASPVLENEVRRQPVTVTAAGQLNRLLHFVSHLEQLPYPVSVVTVGLSTAPAKAEEAAGAPDGAGPVKLEVKVELYSLGGGGVMIGASSGAAEQTSGPDAPLGWASPVDPLKKLSSMMPGKAGEKR